LMEGPMKTTKISFMNAGKLGLEFLHVHAWKKNWPSYASIHGRAFFVVLDSPVTFFTVVHAKRKENISDSRSLHFPLTECSMSLWSADLCKISIQMETKISNIRHTLLHFINSRLYKTVNKGHTHQCTTVCSFPCYARDISFKSNGTSGLDLLGVWEDQ
jgi:hypothetical protein